MAPNLSCTDKYNNHETTKASASTVRASLAHDAATKSGEEDIVNSMGLLYRALGLPKEAWKTPSNRHSNIAHMKDHALRSLDWRALVWPPPTPFYPDHGLNFPNAHKEEIGPGSSCAKKDYSLRINSAAGVGPAALDNKT
ncbi:hypothetical protein K490DRAFT_56027 [Saccharata proteae CBS 121410]|uniref:Uncharacterized protein n=1 Tax=Saccharata proteae CBS 121410 TaxID=1314787 RepID=A0A9P4LYB4_9PEZI|nr:hypothetical protein K490DRAFT_56027 [Saccharata proteae CBS 121410]